MQTGQARWATLMPELIVQQLSYSPTQKKSPMSQYMSPVSKIHVRNELLSILRVKSELGTERKNGGECMGPIWCLFTFFSFAAMWLDGYCSKKPGSFI